MPCWLCFRGEPDPEDPTKVVIEREGQVRRESVDPAELVALPDAGNDQRATGPGHGLPNIISDFKPFFSSSMGISRRDAAAGLGLPGEIYNRRGQVLVTGKAHQRELARRLGLRSLSSYG